ncbi:hypothetical protein [Consotaella aegiceratis]|uniref:hypothetical protein n=1 Tax=Consotaella aegiceratis TaxID=3097961 RepID=UPI002F3FB15E
MRPPLFPQADPRSPSGKFLKPHWHHRALGESEMLSAAVIASIAGLLLPLRGNLFHLVAFSLPFLVAVTLVATASGASLIAALATGYLLVSCLQVGFLAGLVLLEWGRLALSSVA